LDPSNNYESVTLSPTDIAKLLGFEVDVKGPHETERPSPPEGGQSGTSARGSEAERVDLFEKLSILNETMGEVEGVKRGVLGLLERVSSLEERSGALKEEYARSLVEADRRIYASLGIDAGDYASEEAEPMSPHPALGVVTVGVLITLIGAIILLPFRLVPIMRLIIGVGSLLVGAAVLVVGILRIRGISRREEGG